MTLAIVVLNLIGFFIELADPDRVLTLFALWPPRLGTGATAGAPAFHVWQIVTYSALHAGLSHLIFNMLGLVMFGRDVERSLGRARFGTLYLASVVCGALTQLVVARYTATGGAPTIGASAGVFGVLAAYALLYPSRRVVLLFPPIPMPAWVFALVYAGVELLLGVAGAASGIAHFAHLGGMFGALVLVLFWARPRREWPIE
ncbi:rhomboid family intramembrane serine protease [Burkholderia oklahomensis]|uniref:rhomboid family intramembrane serine protease n=1 Tax=Burkholderia oklahomensis TaxID=342113 RepID=UPI00016A7FD7|nr:rhomboid family intramembrane serine protease [Burkholderia oklahomensis]AJX35550.1 rhomboid family protein [Burkholderia oklahomensis C6786]AOI48988.1 rhomboid family intramembrane serine protease [Burkholderia oklahomensis C6786]KUY61108.1 rhomboid family intramembrane serine protease [Burkholderia oklahomensis C6786]MBI0362793.1 rhomboid family intramembrane serine protease [Burkholderia oklahomensis]SUY26900.1 Rhomboid protease gluP [Burkholderia oklahomensis]